MHRHSVSPVKATLVGFAVLLLTAAAAASTGPYCVEVPCPLPIGGCEREVVDTFPNGCYNPRHVGSCCSCTCVIFAYIDDFGGVCHSGPVSCTAENNCFDTGNGTCPGQGTTATCPGDCS